MKTNNDNEMIKNDGWNEEYFDSALEAESILADIAYEVNNCRRLSTVKELKDQLQLAVELIEEQIDILS